MSPTMSTKPHVGLIGVGLMGHGIATNVQKHGYTLSFLSHAGNQPVEDLLAKGAVAKASGADLAAQSDVVILCVTGTPQIEDVMFRADGVLAGLKRRTIVIDCSTACRVRSVTAAGVTVNRISPPPASATSRLRCPLEPSSPPNGCESSRSLASAVGSSVSLLTRTSTLSALVARPV